MADLYNQNQNEDQQAEDVSMNRPDRATIDSVDNTSDSDSESMDNSEITEAGSKGGQKTVTFDNTGEYTESLADDAVDSNEIAQNIDAVEPLDNNGYDEWGYYSTEDDEPADY